MAENEVKPLSRAQLRDKARRVITEPMALGQTVTLAGEEYMCVAIPGRLLSRMIPRCTGCPLADDDNTSCSDLFARPEQVRCGYRTDTKVLYRIYPITFIAAMALEGAEFIADPTGLRRAP